MNQSFYEELLKTVSKEQIKCKEPLSKHTTFHIGGPCDYYVTVKNQKQLCELLKMCKQEEVSYFLIGNGSNLLVSDKGFSGVVIKIDDQDNQMSIINETEDTTTIRVSAGMNLSSFAMKVANLSLTGFEFAAGIPGTVGGAVYMNAGAYDGEIKDCLDSTTAVDGNGNVINLTKEELQLGYRTSTLQKNNMIVADATFTFHKGNATAIRSKITDLNNRRREKQPLEYPSAGSTFKRPEGYFAGKLIMDAGLRGYRVGGAMVSEKHCGFVINIGNSTASDVRQLMDDVIKKVYDEFHVKLEPEVRYIE